MIKKIKRVINELRKKQTQLVYGQNQLWATQKLQSLFPESNYIPQTGWSMTPQAIMHCLNIITIKSSKSIIEFGSGVTTFYIAKLLQIQNKPIKFYSIESDEVWFNQIQEELKKIGLSEYVELVYSPLTHITSELKFKNQEKWYNTDLITKVIEKETHFDFVLVDGPFGGSTPYARYTAMPYLRDKTNKETTWLLDDTNRDMEKQIINEWERELNLSLKKFDRYAILEKSTGFDTTPYTMN